jgi:hypothetical protein
MTPKELERLWEDHLAGEFRTKDVEATLATMVDDVSPRAFPWEPLLISYSRARAANPC